MTVSTVGVAAVKYFGFAGGNGSAGAADGACGAEAEGTAAEGAWGMELWGVGAEGIVAGVWARARGAVSGSSRAAVRTKRRFFNEFLL